MATLFMGTVAIPGASSDSRRRRRPTAVPPLIFHIHLYIPITTRRWNIPIPISSRSLLTNFHIPTRTCSGSPLPPQIQIRSRSYTLMTMNPRIIRKRNLTRFSRGAR